ncbi:Bifunctional NMN adenylyltransferase/Nudix hydrolase [Thalassocella blandensis]|nr:Bifunctional NMN adenylyltransferase/Nudix hydrolase [Thalassocella blandensis]
MAKNQLSERDYLQSYNIHNYDVPLTSVDITIFTVLDNALNVLLVKRAQHPALGKWALPGGFIDLKKDRTLEHTAQRKLKEKTGVRTSYLEQVASFGSKQRDPRGWSVTVAYFALIDAAEIQLTHDERSEEVAWVPVKKVLNSTKLAFDHNAILERCYERLQGKVQYTSLPVNLLPEEFTLSELQSTFEIILDSTIEKKSFRRRILDADILQETGNMRTGSNRPAKLYRVQNQGENFMFSRNIEGPR